MHSKEAKKGDDLTFLTFLNHNVRFEFAFYLLFLKLLPSFLSKCHISYNGTSFATFHIGVLGFYHILNTILLYIRYLTLLRIVCSNIRVTFLKKDFIQ